MSVGVKPELPPPSDSDAEKKGSQSARQIWEDFIPYNTDGKIESLPLSAKSVARFFNVKPSTIKRYWQPSRWRRLTEKTRQSNMPMPVPQNPQEMTLADVMMMDVVIDYDNGGGFYDGDELEKRVARIGRLIDENSDSVDRPDTAN
ncbi:MAG: hypothetical protein LBM73_03560 [Candidatus Nomurabacteria bacterium]|jgi:hypothetical protein|nr:hypothetical protein [Candidatus Nomurabacteria bacterium]